MYTKLLTTFFLSLIYFLGYSQKYCGTMQNLQEILNNDPSVKLNMDNIEQQASEWIHANKLGSNRDRTQYSSINKIQIQTNPASFCGYDNAYFTTISAPTVLGQVISPNPNCTYGGEYVRINNLVAGRVYRISTCGINNFDTQISIYTSGGGTAAAHSDDACGVQSEIYFNPLTNGNYDILIDEYNCAVNTICSNLSVELAYIPRPVITIPVVVHVVHYGESIGNGRNLSVSQIQSQIIALNEDFRRLNSDISTVPAGLRGFSDDPLVEFCLASRDEFGNPTTGIVRWLGTQPTWSNNDIETLIKPSSIWDRDKYLNLWTLEFSNTNLLGYAQFPGGPANTDGVVIRYNVFGFTGNVQAPYDWGRVGVHEVGHWLNLKHIWGDDGSACTGDDFCFDTPNQSNENYGCPSYPLTDGCSPSYPGVMHMNYMDYTDDACKKMFTYGQGGRIDATLFGPRYSLQSSIGCVSTSTGNAEYLMENAFTFPNPNSGLLTLYFNENYKYFKVEILNYLGIKIYETMNNVSINKIDLTNHPNGVYFIVLKTEKGKLTKKMVINK